MVNFENSVSESPMQKKVKDPRSPRSKTNSSFGPGEIQTELTLGDLELLWTQYYIANKFHLELSDSNARVHSLPLRRLALYKKNLRADLRFFIFSFIFELFRFYRIAFCSLSPNFFRYIIGFLILCSQIGVRPSIPFFWALFILKKHPYADWLYVSSQRDATFLVSSAPSSIHG